MPPSGREGDHEVVEGECATAKFVLPMGITLSIHYRLVFRSVQNILLSQAPSVTFGDSSPGVGAKARPEVCEDFEMIMV